MSGKTSRKCARCGRLVNYWYTLAVPVDLISNYRTLETRHFEPGEVICGSRCFAMLSARVGGTSQGKFLEWKNGRYEVEGVPVAVRN